MIRFDLPPFTEGGAECESGRTLTLEAERDEAIAKAASSRRSLRKVAGERDVLRDRLTKAARRHAAEIGKLTAA